MNLLKNQHGIGTHRQSGEEDRNKPRKGPFWNKQRKGGKVWTKVKNLAGDSHVEMLHKCSWWSERIYNTIAICY
jgi:hypothetical protein